MYRVLEPFQKLVYLAFWVEPSTDKAVRLVFFREMDAGRFAEAVRKLEGKGLLERKDKGYAADLTYLAEMIDRDNHLYPDRKLSAKEREELVVLLRSPALRALAGKRFNEARALSSESKDVLSGYFWRIFSGPFAIIQGYRKAFGKRKAPKGISAAIKRSRKFSADAVALAIDQGLVLSFPADLAEFLKWNVNQSPESFVAEAFFKAQRSRVERGGQ